MSDDDVSVESLTDYLASNGDTIRVSASHLLEYFQNWKVPEDARKWMVCHLINETPQGFGGVVNLRNPLLAADSAPEVKATPLFASPQAGNLVIMSDGSYNFAPEVKE